MLSICWSTTKTSKKLFCHAKEIVLFSLDKDPLSYCCIRKLSYVNVYMKWKKNRSYDSIETIYRSPELKPLISLKNSIAQAPSGCIPISDVSKRGLVLDVPIKVAKFLRRYPSVFEEFVGPQYNLPWFRLTPKAMEIDVEEKAIYEDYKSDLQLRLKKLILMTREQRLPLRIIQGVQWYLGLPDNFLKNPDINLDSSFRFVEMENGDRGLAVEGEEKMMSILQKNAVQRGLSNGGWMEPIPFPLFPSRGLRLKRKISAWLDEFQKLPYVSPYEDFSHLSPDSDIAEKRVVGVLHELLCLFVENAAPRKKLLCLKKFLSLPQKFHKAFERHPHMFYLSMKAHTCTAILKEAYEDEAAIERHPLFTVRKRYIELMDDSDRILKQRRSNTHFCLLRSC
ncbi:protein ROOT PRIMORDIUM DEFECTIVE 1-like [Chenopodium quinoa]|uniref:PORR domain-containing protein n=1 Tax=Chenopodium quinoa TaxID=63459 RepID=A0A803KPR2_CHEQI|nr:protein ROOT PRIMORDIUM DEFECTIVE 1-like [Chenopodium quinoa]